MSSEAAVEHFDYGSHDSQQQQQQQQQQQILVDEADKQLDERSFLANAKPESKERQVIPPSPVLSSAPSTPTISAPPANSEKPPVGRIERVASNEDMDLDASPASQATLSFTENSPVTAVPGKQQQADDRGDGGVVENESGIIKLTGVPLAPLHDPTAYIVHSLTFRLEAGENCLILDPTRSRKASLFRLLDTLVPLRSGKMVAPPSTSIYRITSYPNFPTTANLREQLIYPHRAQQALQRGYDDARLYEFLKLFELSHLLRENDVGERGWLMVTDWKKHLTPSERQRIAVIRILYHCPQFVILDDCFRNFGSDNERGKWLEIFFEEATRRRITVLSALNVSMREIEGLPAAEGSDMRALWERLLGWHSKLLEFRSDDDDDDGGGGDGGGNEGGPEYSFTDIVNSGAGRLFTLEDAKRAYREEEELCERAATTAGSGFSTWSEGTSSPSAKQRGRLPPLHAMLAAKFDENQHTSQSQQQPPPLSAAADPMSESFRSLRIISKANRPSTAVLARRLSERLPMKNPTTNPELIISQHSRPPSVARTYSRSASPTASISSVVSSHTAPPTSTAVGTTVNSSQQRLARAANLQQAQQQPQQEREQKQRQSSVGSVASLSQAGSPVLSPSLLAQRGIPSSETGSGHVRRSSTISNDSWHERLYRPQYHRRTSVISDGGTSAINSRRSSIASSVGGSGFALPAAATVGSGNDTRVDPSSVLEPIRSPISPPAPSIAGKISPSPPPTRGSTPTPHEPVPTIQTNDNRRNSAYSAVPAATEVASTPQSVVVTSSITILSTDPNQRQTSSSKRYSRLSSHTPLSPQSPNPQTHLGQQPVDSEHNDNSLSANAPDTPAGAAATGRRTVRRSFSRRPPPSQVDSEQSSQRRRPKFTRRNLVNLRNDQHVD